ncbi:MAG: hypothetical protein L3J39_02875 [Verrucomicrobiales bacterium]|nr:hypothetical protein [Verrucomicrobiales bacterium]
MERKITALHDMRFSWAENYLNSHLIAGRSFSEGPAGKSLPIPKQAIAAKKIFSAWGEVNRFRDMKFDSAIGRIDLKFDRPTLFLDYRQVSWRGRDDAHLLHSDLLLKIGAIHHLCHES